MKHIMYIMIITLILIIISNFVNASMAIVESEFPDTYEDGWRIDLDLADNQSITLNDVWYKEPKRINAYVGCDSQDECTPLITSVEFFVNDVVANTEQAWPYDLKWPTDEANAELPDVIEKGYHTVRAKVTKADGTIVDMRAFFISGINPSQQIDNLTMYMMTTDKTIGMAWDKVTGATSYDVVGHHVEHNEEVLKANVPQQDSTIITFQTKLPRTGHYVFTVRSVQEPLSDANVAWIQGATDFNELKEWIKDQPICDKDEWFYQITTLEDLKTKALEQKGYCSEESSSTSVEYASVTLKDGTTISKGWWIFGFPSPPSGGGVTQ